MKKLISVVVTAFVLTSSVAFANGTDSSKLYFGG